MGQIFMFSGVHTHTHAHAHAHTHTHANAHNLFICVVCFNMSLASDGMRRNRYHSNETGRQAGKGFGQISLGLSLNVDREEEREKKER